MTQQRIRQAVFGLVFMSAIHGGMVRAQAPGKPLPVRPASAPIAADGPGWKKHVVLSGIHNTTAVAGEFSGDGLIDVITNCGGKTRLLVAPDWKELILDADPMRSFIHSEVLDVDGDGDLDYVGARNEPGLIFWYERPARPLADKWPVHLVDDGINGIHGVLVGDVDRDGKLDLLANSGSPRGTYPDSLAWYRIPDKPQSAERWERFILADKDAPGLTHYLGFGDVNGDGRPDAATAAKGGPTAAPGSGDWFAWWEAPEDPRKVWTKHLIAGDHPGATNIHPADVNGDGKTDFVATRGHARGVIWFEAPQWTLHEIHPTILEPHCLAVADFDGDGDIDAATCGYGDKLAVWFENDGKGKFTTHLVAENQAAYDIRAIDMDGDRDLDLLIAGQASQNVVWYENPRPARK